MKHLRRTLAFFTVWLCSALCFYFYSEGYSLRAILITLFAAFADLIIRGDE